MNIPLDEWSGAKATKELQAAIERHQVETNRQTKWMLRLTWVMAVFTLVTVIGLALQIYMAWD